MRIVDLFCGIGGVAEATQHVNAGKNDTPATVVAAIDIDQKVRAIYERNHGITPLCKTLESITEIPDGDLWWLSPPCQPYTRRGRGMGEHDPRSAALLHLIGLINRYRPEMIALENVPQFDGSDHHQRLADILESTGYSVRNELLCPTQWGVPMRRKRFYLRARRDHGAIPDVDIEPAPRTLSAYLDESAWDDLSLRVSQKLIEQYHAAIDLLDPDDTTAVAACFTSAYGNSPVRAGSYLHCPQRKIVRLCSPSEVARLLGFHGSFQWTGHVPLRDRYRLLGNSLAVTVAGAVLRSLLETPEVKPGRRESADSI